MKNYKFLILIFFVFGLSFGSVSCESEVDDLEQFLTLDKESSMLIVGEELVLKANFGSAISPKRTYQWHTDNPEIVSISPDKNYSATIEAKMAGTANVSLASTDGVLIAVCAITVKDVPAEFVDDGVIRILAIGNSFSSDGVESYLY